MNKDVEHCLVSPYAPFAAIAFCLSTIDLLGALYSGQAAPKLDRRRRIKAGGKHRMINPRTTSNSAKYMKKLMHYRSGSISLLQHIFRHKIVHLAQPKPAIEDKNRIITWRYYHNNKTRHMQLVKLKKPRLVKGITPYKLHCTHGFKISISKLKEDITYSVFNSADSYFNSLKTNAILRVNFRRAINEIYNPTKR